MKQTLKYALGAVLGVVLVAPTFAQDNFPDTPDNHWAFEALKNLKADGILVGYPDGLYRGGRMASRYELAIAVHAAYQKLRSMVSGMQSQIDALSSKVDNAASKADLAEVRDQLNSLKTDVEAIKRWGGRIDDLEKLTKTFEKELASLGVDVEAMKKDLGDLKNRVTALEKRKMPVDIGGEVNFLITAGHGMDNRRGATPDGLLTGVGRDGYAGAARASNFTRDLSVFHEFALTLKSTNEEGPKWRGTIVAGNVLGSATFPSQSQRPVSGAGFNDSGRSAYIQELVAWFDTSLAGLNFSAMVGRQGYQVSPYIFKRLDRTYFYDNERWDNGDWYFDGGRVDFKFGGASLTAIAGRNSNRTALTNVDMNPIFIGGTSSKVDQSLGLVLGVPISNVGNVKLAYLWHDTNTPFTLAGVVGQINRLNVYGGEVNLRFAERFRVGAGYSKSMLSYNTSRRLDTRNNAYFGEVGYDGGRWGAMVGYRRVEENFMAAGAWGRLGTFYNPINIKGIYANLWANITPEFKVTLDGHFYDGVNTAALSRVQSLMGRLDYKLNPSWNIMASYEDVEFRFTGVANKPRQRWATLQLDYMFTKNATWGIGYQHNSVQNRGVAGMTAFGVPSGADNYRGGLLYSWLKIRF